MIISASRRTDIPAHYSEWFINRIRAGYFRVANPFNPSQVRLVSLLPDDVDALAFFSKNPEPLMRHLDELDTRGYRYYFHFTLNDYPDLFEPKVPPVAQRLRTFASLAERIGQRRVIWRYDPIIVSSITPVDYHLDRVAALAERLEGSTERVVISLLDFYAKIEVRLRELQEMHGIRFRDVAGQHERAALARLMSGIAAIAESHGMEVFSCSEAVALEPYGVRHGACVDGDLISSLFGLPNLWKKDKNQRPECLCVSAIDMGVYDTCGFTCRYCYANHSDSVIARNMRRHNPNAESLL